MRCGETGSARGPTVPSDNERSSECISVNELAAMLQVSRSHIYKLRQGGRLPLPLKIGAATRWRRSDIVAWLNAGCPSIERLKLLNNSKQAGRRSGPASWRSEVHDS